MLFMFNTHQDLKGLITWMKWGNVSVISGSLSSTLAWIWNVRSWNSFDCEHFNINALKMWTKRLVRWHFFNTGPYMTELSIFPWTYWTWVENEPKWNWPVCSSWWEISYAPFYLCWKLDPQSVNVTICVYFRPISVIGWTKKRSQHFQSW